MTMIQDENVKAISLGVLQQIDLDLVQCEQFAASEPIQGLEVAQNTPSLDTSSPFWGLLRQSQLSW